MTLIRFDFPCYFDVYGRRLVSRFRFVRWDGGGQTGRSAATYVNGILVWEVEEHRVISILERFELGTQKNKHGVRKGDETTKRERCFKLLIKQVYTVFIFHSRTSPHKLFSQSISTKAPPPLSSQSPTLSLQR